MRLGYWNRKALFPLFVSSLACCCGYATNQAYRSKDRAELQPESKVVQPIQTPHDLPRPQKLGAAMHTSTGDKLSSRRQSFSRRDSRQHHILMTTAPQFSPTFIPSSILVSSPSAPTRRTTYNSRSPSQCHAADSRFVIGIKEMA